MAQSLTSTIVLMLILAIAVWTDHRSHRIPNWLTGSALATGLLVHTVLSGTPGLWAALLGALTGFLLFIGPYLLRAMAAGDVKLMAAVGAFLGPQATAIAAAVSLVAGAIVAVSLLTLQVRLHAPQAGASIRAMRFPYASAIAAGALVSTLHQGAPWTL